MELKDLIVSERNVPVFLIPALSETDAEGIGNQYRRLGYAVAVEDHDFRRISTFSQN